MNNKAKILLIVFLVFFSLTQCYPFEAQRIVNHSLGGVNFAKSTYILKILGPDSLQARNTASEISGILKDKGMIRLNNDQPLKSANMIIYYSFDIKPSSNINSTTVNLKSNTYFSLNSTLTSPTSSASSGNVSTVTSGNVVTKALYERNLDVIIYSSSQVLNDVNALPIYHGKISSVGLSSDTTKLSPLHVRLLLQDFPSEPNKSRTLKVNQVSVD